VGSEKLETIERSRRAILSRIDAEEKQLNGARAELRVRQRDAAFHRAALYALTTCRHARREADGLGVPRFLPALLMPVPLVALAFVIGGVWLALLAAVVLQAMAIGAFCAPADGKVAQLIASTESRLHGSRDAVQRLQATIAATAAALDQLRGQEKACEASIEAIRNSREHKLRRLFEHRWKEMRGDQFENYLAEVFAALGYEVQQTGKSGDQGVDLIVQQKGKRIAIQAKGYVDSVSNAAVQQAFTGRTIHGCVACAVITNSRFTSSAVDAADKTGCVLVHEENFEDFVFGRITFH
jgi:hypothetical protein